MIAAGVLSAYRAFPHRCSYCGATSLDLDGFEPRSSEFGPFVWCGICTTPAHRSAPARTEWGAA